MAVNIGNIALKAAYVGSTPLKAIYVGSKQVWTSKPTEVLPNRTSNYGTRDDFRALLTKYGLDYTTVRELPFNLDTSQVTNMHSMFSGCSSLVSVPDLDTSQVTSMLFMFSGCSSLVSVPDLDTSQVTNMAAMFSGCLSLVSVPDLDTSQVTNMNNMLFNCSSLKDGNVRLIRPNGTKPSSRTSMIAYSGLTREPFFLPDGTPI